MYLKLQYMNNVLLLLWSFYYMHSLFKYLIYSDKFLYMQTAMLKCRMHKNLSPSYKMKQIKLPPSVITYLFG